MPNIATLEHAKENVGRSTMFHVRCRFRGLDEGKRQAHFAGLSPNSPVVFAEVGPDTIWQRLRALQPAEVIASLLTTDDGSWWVIGASSEVEFHQWAESIGGPVDAESIVAECFDVLSALHDEELRRNH